MTKIPNRDIENLRTIKGHAKQLGITSRYGDGIDHAIECIQDGTPANVIKELDTYEKGQGINKRSK